MSSDDMSALGRAKAALETLSTVLVIVAASGLVWALFFKQQPTAAGAAAPPPITDVHATIEAEHLTNVAGSGPIAIVEFTDFQCPFCAKHQDETVPTLKKELMESGKARYITMHLPLPMHPQALPAAEAAECAALQGKFGEMHALLFEKQKELPTANFADYAAALELDTATFAKCLSADSALAKVKADEAVAKALQVNSTPTLFIGRMRKDGGADLLRRVRGAVPADVLIEEVAKLKG
jgi:protein-disulfide isomerase